VDLDEFMARSNARARRGRRVARALFAEAIGLVVLLAFLFVAAPNTIGPMMRPSWFVAAMGMIVPGAGVLGLIIGLAWMWRILRANPEPDSRSWRYRR
jgi:protein-S-isoprenylcysteine O-methyltransferase Ste14